TAIATSFLRFKVDDLENYANSQWSLLVQNNLVGNPDFVDAAKSAVASYARSLVREESELIFAIDAQGSLVMHTGALTLSGPEAAQLSLMKAKNSAGWIHLKVGGVERVGQARDFVPLGWYVVVTEKRDAFYKVTTQIFRQTGVILSASLAIAVMLLFFFSYLMTQPLRMVVSVMRQIMSTSDLSRRVEILYKDETGELGHSLNLMTEELEKAYKQIKGYALKAVVAQHREQKIRSIFQKYVPTAVIDEFFANPESMLVGQDRVLAVLFSDIRGFTTLSEGLPPNEVVESLNAYFGRMVKIIMERRGIVDKYIGDAIMATFGAPVRYGDEAQQSVISGFDMLDALKIFNASQLKKGRPQFRIGIGINYGLVTVGNIGSEQKMDYTVIGDMVNLASRLEGLTKVYHEEMIVSESLVKDLAGKIPCRSIDKVVVKGKTSGVMIFAPRRNLAPAEAEAWKIHEKAIERYYARDFEAAREGFDEVQRLMPADLTAARYLERCQAYIKNPPAEGWTGAVAMSEK
ncbi:MAG: adenylate/guanylate cyclase domain-containing protein, partial [Spirochaetia bacterium]